MLCAAAAILLAAGGMAAFFSRPVGRGTGANELVAVGQGFIRNTIRAELKTEFSSAEETHIESLPDKKFLVSGWVDVISGDGEVTRQSFSCVIFKNLSNQWEGEQISLIPQEF